MASLLEDLYSLIHSSTTAFTLPSYTMVGRANHYTTRTYLHLAEQSARIVVDIADIAARRRLIDGTIATATRTATATATRWTATFWCLIVRVSYQVF